MSSDPVWRITYVLEHASRFTRDELRSVTRMKGEFSDALAAMKEADRIAVTLPDRVRAVLSYGVERVSAFS